MSRIKLNIDFGGMLEDIKRAGGDVGSAAAKVAKECAKTVHDELVSECSASGVPSNISREITEKVTETAGGNVYTVEVGWELGNYNPKNISAGYKAVFLNYGTARRTVRNKSLQHRNINGSWVTIGENRGSVSGRGFIARARNSANKKVKRTQKDALKDILKGLT